MDYPFYALMQAIQNQRQNRQDTMQNAQGLGENAGGSFQDFAKLGAMKRLQYAMSQPQTLPVQGPQLAPGTQSSAIQPGMQAPNPAANIMGPLMRLSPDLAVKELIAQRDPLKRSEVAKNNAETGYYLNRPSDAALRLQEKKDRDAQNEAYRRDAMDQTDSYRRDAMAQRAESARQMMLVMGMLGNNRNETAQQGLDLKAQVENSKHPIANWWRNFTGQPPVVSRGTLGGNPVQGMGNPPMGAPQTKVMNGKTFIKKADGWYQQ